MYYVSVRVCQGQAHLHTHSIAQLLPVTLYEDVQHLVCIGEHVICEEDGGLDVRVRGIGEEGKEARHREVLGGWLVSTKHQ